MKRAKKKKNSDSRLSAWIKAARYWEYSLTNGKPPHQELEIEITDQENDLVVEMNRVHRERCPRCSRKGNFLKRHPYTEQERANLQAKGVPI